VGLPLLTGVEALGAAGAEDLLAPAAGGEGRLLALGVRDVAVQIGAIGAETLSLGIVLGLGTAPESVLVGAGDGLGVVEGVPLGAHRCSPPKASRGTGWPFWPSKSSGVQSVLKNRRTSE